MSDLKSLIKRANSSKKELVANTIRLPRELNQFIEDLADQLDVSKHEAVLKLIEAGAEVADQMMEKEAPVLSHFYVLNTNRRHDENDHDHMLSHGIAAAFYAPWKFNIDRIKEGDTVFLYENGVGIVAYGTGTGNTLKKEKYGDPDECHYQELTDFTVLDEPLSAAEIKALLDRNLVFLRTMSALQDGQKVLDRLQQQIAG